MKLTQTLEKVLYRHERTVPFKPEAGLKLRNLVSTQGRRTSSTRCVQEMFNMVSCLKKSEFNQSECAKEIELFRKCNVTSSGVTFLNKPEKKKEQVVGKNLNVRQINEYLPKFSQ